MSRLPCHTHCLIRWGTAIALTVAIVPSIPVVAQSMDTLIAQTSARDQNALRRGRVVLNGSNGQYTGQVMVNASIETAWAVLTDYDNFEQFLPNVTSSRVLRRNGNQRVFEQVNEIRIFPITRRSTIVVQAEENHPTQISFRVIDGDVDSLVGYWQLQPVSANQVILTHQVYIDPGSTNRQIFFTIYRQELEHTLAALKQEMERRAR